MSSSSDVLSNEDPMLRKSNGCRTILDDCDKSKNLFEQHWTLDGRYMSKAGLGYISPASSGEFNEQLCILEIQGPSDHTLCFLLQTWLESALLMSLFTGDAGTSLSSDGYL